MQATVAADPTAKPEVRHKIDPQRREETASVELRGYEGPGEFGGDAQETVTLASRAARATVETLRRLFSDE